ncbi:MAG: LolA family protein [Nocardioidaceae bacterium]
MNLFRTRPGLRWAVPAVAAVLLTGTGATVTAISAAARSGLPPRSAAQLLVDVQNARVHGLSGTVVETTDLGLPSIPGVGDGGDSGLMSLISGSHTLRLWYAGPRQMRLALLGSFGESDIIRNGSELWSWSSTTRSATHEKLAPKAHKAGAAAPSAPSSALPGVSGMTPQQMAEAALSAITPTTSVSTDGTATVAGRSAYELVLQPRSANSLIGSVRVAIDGATHIPTRVQVFARNATSPDIEVGFTSFSPHTPDASVFGFNPPPGTKVTKGSPLSSLGSSSGASRAPTGATPKAPTAKVAPRVVGSDWTTVLVAGSPAMAGPGGGASGELGSVLQTLPRVSGSWGSGRLLSGTLFSVLLTNDGRIAIGAVPPRLLYHALAAR